MITKKLKIPEKTLYIVQTPLFSRLLLSATAAFVLYMLMFHFDTIKYMWLGSSFIFKFVMIMGGLVPPIACLEAFIARLMFTTDYIANRNAFGITTYKSYKDVAQIEYLARRYLTIQFNDNSKIKRREGEAVANKIITIINIQAGKKVPLVLD